jgi:outer membrane protein assembly factor BamA
VAYVREAPAFGSDVSLGKLSADGRAYLRLGESGVLALRLGGGGSFGSPEFVKSYAVGGFPDGALSDVVRSNLTVLRGYPDDAFTGRNYVSGNLELRLPLGHPQGGLRSLPVFLRHLHVTAFLDAGDAWSGAWRASELKTAAGAALGADVNLFHAVPFTFSAGVAHGFAVQGETRAYFRTGLSF